LRYTTFVAAGIFVILTAIIISSLGMPWGAFWAIFSGLLCGIAIGLLAEYYTSGPPIRRIAEQSKTGPATVIIAGLAVGMQSTIFRSSVSVWQLLSDFRQPGFTASVFRQ
jgi:K(+)-stimulated pyrophosphate-energized sodium pump